MCWYVETLALHIYSIRMCLYLETFELHIVSMQMCLYLETLKPCVHSMHMWNSRTAYSCTADVFILRNTWNAYPFRQMCLYLESREQHIVLYLESHDFPPRDLGILFNCRITWTAHIIRANVFLNVPIRISLNVLFPLLLFVLFMLCLSFVFNIIFRYL